MADQSDWKLCAEAIKDLIVALSIDEFTAETVVVRKQSWNRSGLTTGGVILSPGKPSRIAAQNQSDEVIQPIDVVALTPSNQDYTANLETLLGWRESLRDGLHGKNLGASLAYDTDVIPGAVIIPAAFGGQYDATKLTVNCRMRV